MLQQLNAIDAQYGAGALTGHYEIRPHYQNGEPQFVEIDAQRVRYPVSGKNDRTA